MECHNGYMGFEQANRADTVSRQCLKYKHDHKISFISFSVVYISRLHVLCRSDLYMKDVECDRIYVVSDMCIGVTNAAVYHVPTIVNTAHKMLYFSSPSVIKNAGLSLQ